MTMKNHVTVVPDDQIVIVDGSALQCAFTAENIHAVQWHNGKGHIEWTDGRLNTELSGQQDYDAQVAPYVGIWQKEFDSLKAEKNKPMTLEEQEQRIRAERDHRIDDTQWLVSRHAEQVAGGIAPSLTAEQYQELLTYRQALRDLPSQDGFPWGGDIDAAPFPLLPFFM